jgi:hypothetical protein
VGVGPQKETEAPRRGAHHVDYDIARRYCRSAAGKFGHQNEDIHMRLARLNIRPASFKPVTLKDDSVAFEVAFRTGDEARRFEHDFGR